MMAIFESSLWPAASNQTTRHLRWHFSACCVSCAASSYFLTVGDALDAMWQHRVHLGLHLGHPLSLHLFGDEMRTFTELLIFMRPQNSPLHLAAAEPGLRRRLVSDQTNAAVVIIVTRIFRSLFGLNRCLHPSRHFFGQVPHRWPAGSNSGVHV